VMMDVARAVVQEPSAAPRAGRLEASFSAVAGTRLKTTRAGLGGTTLSHPGNGKDAWQFSRTPDVTDRFIRPTGGER